MEWSLTGLPLPIVLRPPSPLTDDALLLLSSRNDSLRIERRANGDISVMTPVGGEGGHREARMIGRLDVWADDDGRGIAFSSNAGFNLPDGSTLSPDASWVSLERWNLLTAEQKKKYPPLCPEFVIEILSESDSRRMLGSKMLDWMENGAQLAWMIDPYAATVTIFRPEREPEVLERPDFVVAEGPVVGFRLTTSSLWAKTE